MDALSRTYTLREGGAPSDRIDFRAELNPEQYAAVVSPGGAALVIAGAGSGKTRTLTYRVAWLLGQGVRPWEILLLTFTNKAAREMIARVSELIPSAAEGIWGGTFHSIGNRILRRHAEVLGFRKGFSILDREDSEGLIATLVKELGFSETGRRFPKASVLSDIFSLSVNMARPIRDILGRQYTYFIPLAEPIEEVQRTYEIRKREVNGMDFDDLLSKVLELFALHPEIAAGYQRQFHHILVDEYQDTNRLQASLVDSLAKGHGNLMVVGDDAQSIYSWRGADFENILRFPKDHPGAVVHKIETNYRSVPQILEVANAAIRANERQFPKNLSPSRAARATRPALVVLPTSGGQATFIAQRILELEMEGVPLEDMAVLYRAHFHSMEIQLELTRRGIPFSITSGLRFFEQAHIKDMAAFLKFVVNPRDETAFKRIARLFPGIGPKSADALWSKTRAILGGRPDFTALMDVRPPVKAARDWAQFAHTLVELTPEGKSRPPAEMIGIVLEAMYDDFLKEKFSNYDARRDDLGVLTEYARTFEDVEEFLTQFALLAGAEASEAMDAEAASGKVTLSTVHQAKGLEWRTVFLVWLTEGMFPHARSAESDVGIEEERRLFYVGITRCKDDLYLTLPELRLHGDHENAFQRPSRFLSEITPGLLDPWEVNREPKDTPF